MTTTFATMAVQDLARAPLRLGEERGVSVVDLLRSATGEDGGSKFSSFRARITRASGVPFSMPNGIVLHQRIMLNGRQRVPAVSLSDVPISLSLMLNTIEARNALVCPDLLATLVRHGMDVEDATNAIADAMSMVSPDIESEELVKELFGGTQVVRCINVPGPNGTLIRVFSAIDIAMAAKKCTKVTATKAVYNLFQKYHNMDLDISLRDEDLAIGPNPHRASSAESQSPPIASGARPYYVRFKTAQGTSSGGLLSLALDVHDACELMFLIPGSELSATMRREAVELMIRVQGGDLSLIDEILQKRAFQDYLRVNDPENPMRAMGEHVERLREAAQATQRDGDEAAVLAAHQQRMMEIQAHNVVLVNEALALVVHNRETASALVLYNREKAARLAAGRAEKAAVVALRNENNANVCVLHARAAAIAVNAEAESYATKVRAEADGTAAKVLADATLITARASLITATAEGGLMDAEAHALRARSLDEQRMAILQRTILANESEASLKRKTIMMSSEGNAVRLPPTFPCLCCVIQC